LPDPPAVSHSPSKPCKDSYSSISAVLDKYKAAALCVHGVLKALLAEVTEGANVLELCKKGDELLVAETAKVYNLKGAHKVQKGIEAFLSLRG
jgi:methionine aminopeptidase